MKIATFVLVIISVLVLQSCIINNPDPDDCVTKEIEVVEITEGGVKDLVFHEKNGDFYYINRGLENGFTLQAAEEAVLNKTITLHLYKFWFGVESEHISQLEVDGKILYSEFGGVTVALNK
jgi:hypothetical protein